MRKLKLVFISLLLFITAGMFIPEEMVIPVQGATSKDWNHDTFWYEPWDSSGVHKGIDIFGKKAQLFAPLQLALLFILAS